MDQKLFTEVYSDKTFKDSAESMLKKVYLNSRKHFQDHCIDFEDFTQEIWCQLFEAKRFSPDRALCMEIMKGDAHNFVRDLRNRDDIFQTVEYIDDEEIEI